MAKAKPIMVQAVEKLPCMCGPLPCRRCGGTLRMNCGHTLPTHCLHCGMPTERMLNEEVPDAES